MRFRWPFLSFHQTMQPNDRGLQQHSKRLVSQDFVIVKLLSMWSLVITAGTEVVRHSADCEGSGSGSVFCVVIKIVLETKQQN